MSSSKPVQTIGYACVLSNENAERRLQHLGDVDKAFVDHVGSLTDDRPQLAMLVEYVRGGDTVRSDDPARFAASTLEALKINDAFTEKGVLLAFDGVAAMDPQTPMGQFLLTVTIATAKYLREHDTVCPPQTRTL